MTMVVFLSKHTSVASRIEPVDVEWYYTHLLIVARIELILEDATSLLWQQQILNGILAKRIAQAKLFVACSFIINKRKKKSQWIIQRFSRNGLRTVIRI